MKKTLFIITAWVVLSLLFSSCNNTKTVELSSDTEKWLEGEWVYKQTVRIGGSTTDDINWMFNTLKL